MIPRIIQQTAVVVMQVIVIAFSLFCAIFFIPMVRDTIAHNLERKNMEFSLTQVSHPANSVFISSRSTVGLYTGNGNHCDYFAGQLRQYLSSKQSILDFYRGKNLSVLFIDGGSIDLDYLTEPQDWGLASEKLPGKYYIVFLTSYINPPGYDIRCH